MFNFLGRLTTRHPWKIVAVWLLLGAALTVIAPRWEGRVQDDDIRFLPARCDSVKGYRLLEQAFPNDVYASRLIFTVERQDGSLTRADFALIDAIVGDLETLRQQEPDLKIGRIDSHKDPFIGNRLQSKNGQCSLIQVALGTPYLALQTRDSVEKAEQVVRRRLDPATGLQLCVTGPAGIGRDLTSASASSLDRTTLATVVLVVVILLLVYRSPLLALVPLTTIAISVWVALKLLALCTLLPGFHVVNVTQIFAIVMLYGAGTDYCLFLVSRYREELGGQDNLHKALSRSVGKVGGALLASAGTVICGLGLMGLAEFAKVRSGGPAIALSLSVALAASLTLAPALLCLLGRAVFWPVGTTSKPVANPVPERILRRGSRPVLWERLSNLVVARPLLIFTVAVVTLLPLALIGSKVKANYRATGELSSTSSSVQGLQVLQRHFTAGETGPITVLLASRTDWESREGLDQLAHLSQAMARLENVAEVRSLTQPLGEHLKEPSPVKPAFANLLQSCRSNWNSVVYDHARTMARPVYLAKVPQLDEAVSWLVPPTERSAGPVHVARLDVVMHTDPFDAESVPTLDVVQTWVKEQLPRTATGLDGLAAETYGVTVGWRDLAAVTESDRSLINLLVLGGIFLILLLLVRKLWLAGYLLVTVLFSYYVTLGATTLLATWWTGRTVGEVDWRVPFFLFTILVAVGEDYNILLITRALRERKRLGGVEGMRQALARTGGTITSCGLIMAGTFATLMLSGLNTLMQIGFALAFGVLLDTFVVRPFLVPAFVVLIWRRQEPPAEEPAILTLPRQRKRRAA